MARPPLPCSSGPQPCITPAPAPALPRAARHGDSGANHLLWRHGPHGASRTQREARPVAARRGSAGRLLPWPPDGGLSARCARGGRKPRSAEGAPRSAASRQPPASPVLPGQVPREGAGAPLLILHRCFPQISSTSSPYLAPRMSSSSGPTSPGPSGLQTLRPRCQDGTASPRPRGTQAPRKHTALCKGPTTRWCSPSDTLLCLHKPSCYSQGPRRGCRHPALGGRAQLSPCSEPQAAAASGAFNSLGAQPPRDAPPGLPSPWLPTPPMKPTACYPPGGL